MLKTILPTLFLILSMSIHPMMFAQGKVAQQKAADDKLLTEFFAATKISPTKTKSGLYYAITKPGTGRNAMRGQTLTINYTGQTLDGKVFDSNIDPEFGHPSPLTFSLGMGQVIKGWDEGIQLLNAGSEAVLYIPSGLAYGARGAGDAIPPNAILIFDVVVLSIDK